MIANILSTSFYAHNWCQQTGIKCEARFVYHPGHFQADEWILQLQNWLGQNHDHPEKNWNPE